MYLLTKELSKELRSDEGGFTKIVFEILSEENWPPTKGWLRNAIDNRILTEEEYQTCLKHRNKKIIPKKKTTPKKETLEQKRKRLRELGYPV